MRRGGARKIDRDLVQVLHQRLHSHTEANLLKVSGEGEKEGGEEESETPLPNGGGHVPAPANLAVLEPELGRRMPVGLHVLPLRNGARGHGGEEGEEAENGEAAPNVRNATSVVEWVHPPRYDGVETRVEAAEAEAGEGPKQMDPKDGRLLKVGHNGHADGGGEAEKSAADVETPEPFVRSAIELLDEAIAKVDDDEGEKGCHGEQLSEDATLRPLRPRR